MGFNGRVLRFIKNLYSNLKAVVRVNDALSEEFTYQVGVRQGCPASPILFNLYINDLLERIEGVAVEPDIPRIPGLLFADDAVILAENEVELKQSMIRIEEWCSRWKMSLNTEKCGVMAIGDELTQPITYNGEVIPVCTSYTYLGLPITNTLDLSEIIKDRKEKAKKAFFSVKGFLAKRDIPVGIKLRVLKGVLIPICTYGCELYGMSAQRVSPLQKVMDNGVKLILAAPSNYCRKAAFNELGLESIQVRGAKLRVRGYSKWRNSKTWMRELLRVPPKARCATWVSGTTRWINKFGGGTYNKERPVQENVEIIRDSVLAREVSRDRSAIGRVRHQGKLLSMVPHMRLMAANNHLYKGWNALMRLRIGVFPLAYKLAAYGKIDSRYKSTCPCCGGGKETTFHLLWECSKWHEQRMECLGWLYEEKSIVSRALTTRVITNNPREEIVD
ncbi:MAG: reverse transcriptase family protein, partial [Mucinivorans sp.]